jgi:hypothetical protein
MEEDMIQLDLSQYDELDLQTTEALYLNELAALWAHVEANNISPTEVKAFTWRDAYDSLGYTSKTHFNAVRLTNDVIPLPVIAKPTIPDSMPVTVKEIAS